MPHFKYPSTFHLPMSPGIGREDRILKSIDHFSGKQVIVTEKMDGENTTMYLDNIHARSLDSRNHPSRNLVKGIWGGIRYLIEDGYRIVGENVYAKHSISYENLQSFFYGFAMYDPNNMCLSWVETVRRFKEIGIVPVTTFHAGEFNMDLILMIFDEYKKNIESQGQEVEGFVLRLADEFHYDDFDASVAKYVRAGHVQTDKFWMNQPVVPNELSN